MEHRKECQDWWMPCGGGLDTIRQDWGDKGSIKKESVFTIREISPPSRNMQKVQEESSEYSVQSTEYSTEYY
jgi:hypothetical protein